MAIDGHGKFLGKNLFKVKVAKFIWRKHEIYYNEEKPLRWWFFRCSMLYQSLYGLIFAAKCWQCSGMTSYFNNFVIKFPSKKNNPEMTRRPVLRIIFSFLTIIAEPAISGRKSVKGHWWFSAGHGKTIDGPWWNFSTDRPKN